MGAERTSRDDPAESHDRPPPKVTIVGAGIAGMTASLRLLERGFDVTLLEQDHFMGGMLRACTFDDEDTGDRHEHSYHMVLNWYHNLWDIIDELGLRQNFTPSDGFTFIRRGHTTPVEMHDVGAPSDFLRNMMSGAAPLPDLFIFMYSLIDILSTPINDDDLLDDYSVSGFMRSRPYATERAATLHQKVWETVWAIPSYDASAKSYQTFLKYGNYEPIPGMWLFNKNKYDALIGPIEQTLYSHGDRFRFIAGARINKLKLDDRGNVDAIIYKLVDRSPSIHPHDWKSLGKEKLPITGDLIIATTPGTMAHLATGPVFDRDPDLGNLRKLHSEPMASVELHFKKGKWLRHVPTGVSVLMDAQYQMTFLDYSQLWKDQDSTFLYVTVSDFASLMPIPAERRSSPPENRLAPGVLMLDLDRPTTAIEYLLVQLRQSLPFDVDDIDLERTRIQTNDGEQLFANETGSHQWRPGSVTRIPNLFLAGTYCRNFADVATIEGAVASGLTAAEHVRARANVGDPIEVKTAGYYNESVFKVLKWLWMPYAYGAKAWSTMNDIVSTPSRDFMSAFVDTWRTIVDPESKDPYRRRPGHRR